MRVFIWPEGFDAWARSLSSEFEQTQLGSAAIRRPPMRSNLASETERALNFGGVWRPPGRTARVGRVSPRPQDHRQPVAPIRPNAFPSRNGSRPNRVQLRPRSCGLEERRALPARSPDRHLKLTRR
jgi:hypothetical protein